ncbi:cephalosporin hydroxylase family protein [Solidesulfovibrio sp.]|uniref:cephalosporin hydroxylase family protein n=1 Tax=Solidesulfovibrio sp. TaxID=2910990 RepID=UPI00261679C5|nr:cephalosporin hydroxylase family protein [Solidesulfovibrio sp.]
MTQEDFKSTVAQEIENQGQDQPLQRLTLDWVKGSSANNYTYHFEWMGRPIIQFPQDILAMQEIIWRVRPELIIETGIAHGGSLVFYASMLELLGGDRWIVGIDIDIRPHNRAAIEAHPMAKRIVLVEGSSIDPAIVARIRDMASGKSPVLVVLDSNHTHEHVLAELRTYAPLVSAGSYLVVFDTLIERMPESFFPNRPWGPGNNPMSAVDTFLAETDRFAPDAMIENKLLITVAPKGYLKCLKE